MRYTGKDTQFLSQEQQRISAHKPAVTLPFKNQPYVRYVLHWILSKIPKKTKNPCFFGFSNPNLTFETPNTQTMLPKNIILLYYTILLYYYTIILYPYNIAGTKWPGVIIIFEMKQIASLMKPFQFMIKSHSSATLSPFHPFLTYSKFQIKTSEK